MRWVIVSSRLVNDGLVAIPTATLRELRTQATAAYAVEDETYGTLTLYRLPARGSPLTRSINTVADPNAWRVTTTAQQTASLGKTPVTVNTATITRPAHYRSVWWFYVVDGQATASKLEAKLLQARAALHGGAHVGAFVALSSEADDAAAQTDSLARFLEALRPPPGAHASHVGG